jgi:hypothetical protein
MTKETSGKDSTGLAKVLPSLAREIALIASNTSDLRNVSLQRPCYSSTERLTLASHARGRQNEKRGVAWCSDDPSKALRCRIHLVISYHASNPGYLDLVDVPI